MPHDGLLKSVGLRAIFEKTVYDFIVRHMLYQLDAFSTLDTNLLFLSGY